MDRRSTGLEGRGVIIVVESSGGGGGGVDRQEPGERSGSSCCDSRWMPARRVTLRVYDSRLPVRRGGCF